MSEHAERADFVPMSNETRGKALKDRMVAMGLDESKLARAVKKDRGTIRRVFEGKASSLTYDYIEQWFDREDAKNNADSSAIVQPAAGGAGSPVVIRMEEGGTVVIEGPVDHLDEIAAVARALMRETKSARSSGTPHTSSEG